MISHHDEADTWQIGKFWIPLKNRVLKLAKPIYLYNIFLPEALWACNTKKLPSLKKKKSKLRTDNIFVQFVDFTDSLGGKYAFVRILYYQQYKYCITMILYEKYT
jgi:hypothetical protein